MEGSSRSNTAGDSSEIRHSYLVLVVVVRKIGKARSGACTEEKDSGLFISLSLFVLLSFGIVPAWSRLNAILNDKEHITHRTWEYLQPVSKVLRILGVVEQVAADVLREGRAYQRCLLVEVQLEFDVDSPCLLTLG